MNEPEAPEASAGESIPAAPEATRGPEPRAPEPGGDFWYGTGRRKTSVARVFLRSGNGQLRVNGRPLQNFFVAEHWRAHAREPLVFIDGGQQYDAEITVAGGGNSGQAGAIRQGLARALAVAQPGARPKLRKGGFLTRDPRMKERKKYGQKGARRRFQWTKR